MFAFAPKDADGPDSTALFDYDEARLAAGSGSELLDAYLSPSNANPYEPGPDTPLAAICAASAEERGDIFARVCALILARDEDEDSDTAWARLDRVLPYLRGLLMTLRDTEMSLPSAAAAQLIRQDRTICRAGVVQLQGPAAWREPHDRRRSQNLGDHGASRRRTSP